MKHHNPFYSGSYAGIDTYAIDSETRIERVKQFTKDECELALRLRGIQVKVQKALRARLRKLERGE